MQIGVFVTAASSGQGWDLRCTVREALIDVIQREHPKALPRVRADVGGELSLRGSDTAGARADLEPVPA